MRKARYCIRLIHSHLLCLEAVNEAQLAILYASSPLAWVQLNKTVNENQELIEFKDHRFMIDIYSDDSSDLVCRKSAQVGFSVMAILKSVWSAGYGGWNIIYALPTNNVVNDFVKPKVNPLITSNPAIARMVSDDSVSYKRIGERNLFFKGGYSDRDAISITGDILVIDEYDRMPNMQVVNTFDSRLQASKNPKRWRFSNPSMVGFGVDGLYNDSDQMTWFVTHSCGYRSYLEFSRETAWRDSDGDHATHYVNVDRQVYACGRCDGEITDDDRRRGEWIARYPSRSRRGYWISQLMAPWVSAARILEQKNESSVEFFHNFVLGKAYTPSDMIVNRETILRATSPSLIAKTGVAMGVDQDAGGQYYVLMTAQGIFAHGYAKSWEEIEHLKLMYSATLVIDPNPYSTHPKRLAQKYNDVYLCYFKEMKGMEIVDWNGSTVYADRTRILDLVANEITQATLLFREHPYQLEDVIAHWNNIYRTTEEKEDGRMKSVWLKKDNKQSDYPFAMLYARLALSRSLGGGSSFIEPADTTATPITDTMAADGQLQTDMRRVIDETFAEME